MATSSFDTRALSLSIYRHPEGSAKAEGELVARGLLQVISIQRSLHIHFAARQSRTLIGLADLSGSARFRLTSSKLMFLAWNKGGQKWNACDLTNKTEDTHTHLLRTIFANSDVECILRAKTLQLYLTEMGRWKDPREIEKLPSP